MADPIEFKTYAYHDIDAGLWRAWQQKSEKWGYYPFQSALWARSGVADYNHKTDLFLLAAEREGKYLGFFPYKICWRLKGGCVPIKYCLPWNDVMPVGFVIAPHQTTDFYAALFKGFFCALPRWHILISGLSQTDSPVANHLQRHFQATRIAYSTTEYIAAEIRGFDCYDDYLSSLSTKWRRNYRKAKRRLLDSGAAQLVHLTTFSAADLADTKARIMGIYRESWKITSTDDSANLMKAKAYSLFSNLVNEYAAIGGLHIMILTLNGEDAAFAVGFHQGGFYCSFQIAYKEKFRKDSVGFSL